MNRWIDANFIIPEHASRPDRVEFNFNGKPNDNFIVSRNRNGNDVSKYKDDVWDFTAYDPRGRTFTINFKYWTSGSINDTRRSRIDESKLIFFGLMWHRNGPPISIGTLRNYLTVIRAIAKYSEVNSCAIKSILIDEKKLWDFAENHSSGWMVETLGSLLTQLTKINFDFPIVGEKFRSAVRSRGLQYRGTLSQHPPIPTKIYSRIIDQLNEMLDGWMAVEDDILELIEKCTQDFQVGRAISSQKNIAYKHKFEFRECPDFFQIATPKCLAYIEQRQQSTTVKGLSAVIGEIFVASKLTIQLFTGMRDGEAFSLPFHCIQRQFLDGKEHYIVVGRTTKLNSGIPQTAKWVTNINGYKAIKIAQRISSKIYAAFRMNSDSDDFKKDYRPLFLSLNHFGLNSAPVMPKNGKFSSNTIPLKKTKLLRQQLEPAIEEDDILELEMIDPHRPWRANQLFQPGKRWNFTSHQLRRSLALYAQRSGLVTLPSLRRQLQHITNEMALYYSRGSIYAKDFIAQDDSHIAQLWQDAQSESAGLSYIKNVLLSNEILFGGHASWIMNRLQQPDGAVLVDREKTLQSFKRGEMFYKETLIGGCTNREPCSQSALKWINTECLSGGCKNLVCSLSKLEKVILAQQKMVSSLDSNSLEYRTEKADLDVLISAKEKALNMRKQGI